MRPPMQAAPVARGLGRLQAADGVAQSGCNVFKCAAHIPGCIGVCASGIGSAACITCLGSAYEACKDCF